MTARTPARPKSASSSTAPRRKPRRAYTRADAAVNESNAGTIGAALAKKPEYLPEDAESSIARGVYTKGALQTAPKSGGGKDVSNKIKLGNIILEESTNDESKGACHESQT